LICNGLQASNVSCFWFACQKGYRVSGVTG
jgi:hypothetical protein